MKAAALLQAKDVQVDFTVRGRRLQAVAGVTLCLAPAEALGLVGESGCGKSTFGRALVRLVQPTAGTVCFDGIDVTRLDMARLRILRRRMPIVFQDPISSLNPRRSIGQTIAEPMRYAGLRDPAAQARQTQALLERVGLDPALAARQPHQLSGGQCQRVSIARALAAGPQLLICDEAVSALDVSVQAQIVNLLQDLRRARALALLFISHDLAVVRRIADRVAVMYLGRLCEVADVERFFAAPAHPYSQALLSAVPDMDGKRQPARITLHGELPSPLAPPSGCRFRTRCPRAQARCAAEAPLLREIAPGSSVACHFPDEPAP
ncbi:ABC transporter ATP-binding protein [Verminephrobacter eiseniae]|uniref:Oligopeptide/dipeptide ABC transporter, ATPase subunit n=1 Tax=Verminephrobacter eiseniae (strain EF01-2) TaxID=391735 RepID=A1WGF6_VEREI|nr:oligopeptide/dipeptide ABC transporter ATP-binding protein [Verminephrobacter eiseniae]ABM56713.1 oligopeptide/dipeptide ABC transporter, ATPase subunit [Verminephrobacter eiseniae EF01-2]MCW5261912.1 ABC transporter ATP-binding protein [Verminephrobacter eiseniae]MCW5287070.1 ABC transporter ATP-binding protein [Verminephrobacter eiseniae]MCW5305368.1 ABC transporter ATP-binding protein [Verminephrobacter eiseniae]MCW8182505.1 ATP-binding cassette domain-containing protein [Verminephrobact